MQVLKDAKLALHVMTIHAASVESGYVHDVHRFPVGEDHVVYTVYNSIRGRRFSRDIAGRALCVMMFYVYQATVSVLLYLRCNAFAVDTTPTK